MAKKEEKDAPAYIDYSGASTDGSSWTGTDILDYFRRQVLKRFNVSNLELYTIKNRTLAKRLADGFSQNEIEKMVQYWMDKYSIAYAINFGAFYKNRFHTISEISQRDNNYGWD